MSDDAMTDAFAVSRGPSRIPDSHSRSPDTRVPETPLSASAHASRPRCAPARWCSGTSGDQSAPEGDPSVSVSFMVGSFALIFVTLTGICDLHATARAGLSTALVYAAHARARRAAPCVVVPYFVLYAVDRKGGFTKCG